MNRSNRRTGYQSESGDGRVYLQLGAAEDSPGEDSLAEGSRPAEEGSPAGSIRCWPFWWVFCVFGFWFRSRCDETEERKTKVLF